MKSVTVLILTFTFNAANSQQPPTLRHTSQVRNYLSELSLSDQFAIGQNIGHSNHRIRSGYEKFIATLERKTGRVPVILGIDLGYGKVNGFEPSRKILRRHFLAGGLVTLSMHPPNPWHGTASNDSNTGIVSDLLNPKTSAHIRWMGSLVRAADSLAELQKDGVVVLWRPLHEMNGGWFWWGADKRWTRHDARRIRAALEGNASLPDGRTEPKKPSLGLFSVGPI